MLEGIIRDSIEKKATKALRRDGYLIANIYGKGEQNINAAFKANEFIKAAKSKETLIFPVKVAGKEYNVVIQDYQRDPVNSNLLHVDLRIALPGVLSKYLVPVVLEGLPIGTKNKGVLIQSKKRLTVKCTAENLPNSFVVDVSGLDVGNTILVRDIPVPANVIIMDETRVSVAGVIKAK
ncbi:MULTISPECIES: 50S ribosomal protein L25/general stress protein Ctc [unclassified Sulfurospirillum]|uniref:50S ribosomal protein L25/general stress protein Ctc n=1 Tax=unclassified Sulfurospirillum TaxID=2618290 RepID=UPI000503E55F|nr:MULTISPECIES: 50S ribosomal protein L25/general stress protein Ctc [unclassified Sulfurospirillum]KFL34147.1 50S ribosomal protein L25 [Sulfurospirillum sp. SCADC]